MLRTVLMDGDRRSAQVERLEVVDTDRWLESPIMYAIAV